MTPHTNRLSRRQFIRMTAIAGLFAASGAGLAARLATPAVRTQETRLLLGSIANLTVISPYPDQAQAAIAASFDRMAALEDVFSRFRPHSALSQLNSDGYISEAHPALREVLVKAVDYGHLTRGAFDVTVEPVLRLYREATKTGKLPEPSAVVAAQELVDYRRIAIAGDSVRLGKSGMAVTLDGIAKGYIIDAGVNALREYGFEQVMVELGGDLQAHNDAGSRPWQVGIQQPVPDTDTVANTPLVTQVTNRALATSGDYQYTFTPDRRLHHIIDPDSGISPGELASASVMARTACDADALATAIMVMGAQAGLALVEGLPDTAALVISKQGAVHFSARFPLRQ